MEEGYYIPEIEEFHVGFEYQYSEYGRKIWIDEIGDKDDILMAYSIYEEDNDEYNKSYRVKYIDQKDIKSFGFECEEDAIVSNSEDVFTIKKDSYTQYILICKYSINKIFISVEDLNTFEQCINNLFIGTIKNKSELKKLLLQLNIN